MSKQHNIKHKIHSKKGQKPVTTMNINTNIRLVRQIHMLH